MNRLLATGGLLLALAGCDEGSPLLERGLSYTGTGLSASLAPSASANGSVQICPAIRTGVEQGQAFTAYQPGLYSVSVEGLPPGVTASFPQGHTLDMPDPKLSGVSGWNDQSPYPPAGATSDERFCWTWPVVFTRDATPGAGTPVPIRVVLRIQRRGGSPAVLDLDAEYPLQGVVTRLDAGAGAPPVTGQACTAGDPLPGRWQDLPVGLPPERPVAGYLLGFTLVQDRPLLVRSDRERVMTDEWSNGAWESHDLIADGAVDSVSVAAWRDPVSTQPRRFAAWVATSFNRPTEQQSRLEVSERGAFDMGWNQPFKAAEDISSNLRSLQLAGWRGQAVLGWLWTNGLSLRVGRPSQGFGELPSPAMAPGNGLTRQLRLAVDPVTDALVLALARVDADGVTRAYTWRLSAPGAEWEALPVLEVGDSASYRAGLGGFALTALAGEVTLAWSFGEVNFSGPAQLALQVWRSRGGAWAALGTPGNLLDAARRYAMQPLGLTLAPTCSGGVFMAWNEPQQYPMGELFGAQFSARDGWDPFGRNPVATLPGGGGSFSSLALLASDSSGRPVLAGMISPPSGGLPRLVLRRYAP